MADKFSTYPTYRDSGVDWIGKVPSEWVVLATARVSDLTTGERDTQDASEDGAFPFFVRSQAIERINTYSFDGEGVLTSGDGAGVGKIFHHHIGKFEFHQRVYLFHNFRRITGRFFFYFLREHLHLVALAGNAKSTVDSLRRPMLRMFPICLPSLEEQTQIAKFLDYETAKIDALVAKQQQLIALLQEKRQAVISHAVTKGLNPAAPLRDSGVEWLGQVPAHWEVSKIGYISHVVRGQTPRPAGSPVYFFGDVLPWITVGEITKDDSKWVRTTQTMLTEAGVKRSIIFPEGTLVLSNSGATLGVPKILGITGCMNDGVAALLNFSAAMSKDYTYYFLCKMTQPLRDYSQGMGQPNLNTDLISGLYVPKPPLEEQKAIADFIEDKLSRIDIISRRATETVALLQERRTALIAAAVTGKIDVRGWQPPVANAAAGFDEPHGAKATVLASDAG